VLTTFGLRFATFTLTFGFLAEKHGWSARKNAYEALAAKAGRRLCLLLVAWWVIKPVWQRRFVSFVAARLLSFGSARHYPCSCAAAASFNAGGTSPRSLGIPISEKEGVQNPLQGPARWWVPFGAAGHRHMAVISGDNLPW